jgi:hypothetical protein
MNAESENVEESPVSEARDQPLRSERYLSDLSFDERADALRRLPIYFATYFTQRSVIMVLKGHMEEIPFWLLASSLKKVFLSFEGFAILASLVCFGALQGFHFPFRLPSILGFAAFAILVVKSASHNLEQIAARDLVLKWFFWNRVLESEQAGMPPEEFLSRPEMSVKDAERRA